MPNPILKYNFSKLRADGGNALIEDVFGNNHILVCADYTHIRGKECAGVDHDGKSNLNPLPVSLNTPLTGTTGYIVPRYQRFGLNNINLRENNEISIHMILDLNLSSVSQNITILEFGGTVEGFLKILYNHSTGTIRVSYKNRIHLGNNAWSFTSDGSDTNNYDFPVTKKNINHYFY